MLEGTLVTVGKTYVAKHGRAGATNQNADHLDQPQQTQ